MPFAEFGVKVRQNNKQFFRRIPYNINEEEEILEQYRKLYYNIDVYRSVFTYDNANFSNARIKGPLYFDLDFGVDFAKDHVDFRTQTKHCIMTLQQYLQIPADQIYLYFSGGKGYHIIVPETVLGLGYCDKKDLIKNYKDLANLIKLEWEQRYHTESYIDLKVYDHRRMFRLPNSINGKGQRYKILLPGSTYSDVSYADLSTMSLEPSSYEEGKGHFCAEARRCWDFLTTDSNPDTVATPSQGPRRKKHKGGILPCVLDIMNTEIPEGQRNNTAIALANALLQHDIEFDEILDIMIAWNSDNNPPLPDEELYNTVRSARSLDDKDWHYGCTTVKELGFCNNSCKLRKENNNGN